MFDNKMLSSIKNTGLLEFEKTDKKLIFIPLIVRYKLDLISIKLHLKEWRKLSHPQKELLITTDCESESNRIKFKLLVISLINSIGHIPTKLSEKILFDTFPIELSSIVKKFDLSVDFFWQRINNFQKFVVIKLFKKSHKKEKEITQIIKTFQLKE